MIPSRRRPCRRAIQTKCCRFQPGVNSGNSPSIVNLATESLSYGRFLSSMPGGIITADRGVGSPRPGCGQRFQRTCVKPRRIPGHSQYGGKSDDVFIIDDENARNWLERHIDPLSSIFRAWQKRWHGDSRWRLADFAEPQNTRSHLRVVCPSP